MAPRYEPCRNGIHVIGEDADTESVTDIADFPMGADRARETYARLKAEFEVPEEADLVVDLMIDGNLEDAFHLHRQMLPRLEAAIRVG